MIAENNLNRLSDAFEKMIVSMQEVDNFCVHLTKDISKQDLSLLSYGGGHGDVIMRDIVNFLDVPYSTATGIVDKLVQNKYLKRFNSEKDRRTVLVGLTTGKGQKTYDFFMTKKMEMSSRIMSILNDHEQEMLLNLMEKIAHNIKGSEQGE